MARAENGDLHISFEQDRFFERLVTWLDMESEAERERVAERSKRRSGKDVEASGDAVIDLVVAEHDVGLGGRFLLTLVKRKRTAMPWTRLKSGTPISLSGMGEDSRERSSGSCVGCPQIKLRSLSSNGRLRICFGLI